MTRPIPDPFQIFHASGRTPVVFVHGLWPLPSNWDLTRKPTVIGHRQFRLAKRNTFTRLFAVPAPGALLIISGEKDHTAPRASSEAAFRKQERNSGVTEFVEIPDRGHSLTIDSGWRTVAETSMAFIGRHLKGREMAFVTTKDGVQIFYKDWGPGDGRAVVFSHGWPLHSDSWEAQMLHLATNGYRVIAHDRRGHGRSTDTWDGNDMDHYADDLAEVMDALDLRDATLIGFSTGGGEVARYIGRHGTARIAQAALVSAVPPLMLKTPDNPNGTPIEVFDGLRAGSLADRSQLYKDLAAGPFFGFNRPGAKVSQGMQDSFWLQGMMAGHKAAYDCIKAFSETDLTEDLRRFDVPTLVIHGDDDQVVPIDAAGRVSAQIVKDAELKVYPGAPHGITDTHKEQLNAELLDFVNAWKR